jgi:hydroxyacylglutathione hydrolase
VLFRQVYDRRHAQYAYLIGCQATGEAIIIDPMRDVERYLDMAEEEGVRLVAAAETHIHADFLSGMRELAERAGVTIYASDEGGPDWSSEWIRAGSYTARLLKNGDTFRVGNIRFDVVHTPGHTPEHVAYLVTDEGGGATQPMGLLSGDFVFVGDVGRPDLLESAAGQAGAMEPSARTLYQSIESFRGLPPELQLWPAHGSGSACGKALGAVPMSTVGYELAVNASILAATSEDAFVSYILDGQPEPPLYFGRMKIQNKEGPAVLGAVPNPRRIRDGKLMELSGATGVAVCDTRPWENYMRAHLPGSLYTPLNTKFNTTAGSFVPDGMPIYLIVEEEQLREAVIDLIHVGLDNVVGYATPEMFAEHAHRGGDATPCKEFAAATLSDHLGGDEFLIDVRTAAEVKSTGRIPGAHNIAHTRLLERIDEVPKDKRVVLYCQTGQRSAYSTGLLDRHGHEAVNVGGGLERWLESGGVAVPALG